jgi:iron complex outermembrane receptor protein
MRRSLPRLLALALLPWISTAAWAAVEGRVVTSSGLPLEGARVELLETAQVVSTGARGELRFPDAEPPARLLVTHPRFRERTVTVAAKAPGPLVVTLAPKQEVYEEIVVSAERAGDAFAPAAITSTVVEPAERLDPPSTLLEVVDQVPGVAENGQAGIFQVFSIRGIARQRILTLISGMQITSERRAGVSASFVDPLLMGSVDLLRGPASSYYGSGALGGVVQVFPRRFDALSLRAGWDLQGSETWQGLGWGRPGDDGLSLGLVHRRAGDAEAADGTGIHSRFEQTSATLRKRWTTGGDGGKTWELLAIPTVGRDIGKANTDFPERTTDYPEENHLLVKLSLQAGDRWSLYAWAHPHELVTETRRSGGRRDTVSNQTFDLGANFQREALLSEGLAGRFGVDYFGRRGVDAVEEELLPGAPSTRVRTLDGGEQDEAAAYGSLRRHFGRATLEVGGRATRLRQANAGEPDLSRSAGSGFVGAVVPLGKGFELAANAGTGIRFPSLSERFFTGTTGRGDIVANRDLAAERSLNTDLRLRFYGRRLFIEVDAFRNAIDDYIERVEIEPDVLTFVNLTSGTLRGLETEGFFEIDRRWRLSWGGHAITGEDDAGGALADVPPDRVFVGLRRTAGPRGRVSWGGRLERRGALERVGSGEKPIPAATLVSARVAARLTEGLELTLTGSNLLDEAYFSSADDKAPLAAGRSVGVGVAWRR